MINWWEETINEYYYAFDRDEEKEIYYFVRYSLYDQKINLVLGVSSNWYIVHEKDVPEKIRMAVKEYMDNPFFEIDVRRCKEGLKK